MLIYHVFALFMFIYLPKKTGTFGEKIHGLGILWNKKPTDLVSPGLRLF